MFVSLALLLAGLLLLNMADKLTRPFADGPAAMMDVWPAVAAACLALAALAVFLLRRRPLARGEIGFVVFMGLPGLFLGGMGVAMIAGG